MLFGLISSMGYSLSLIHISLRARNSLLVIRAKLGMNTIPSARITLYSPGPSSAINTSASRIPGKERGFIMKKKRNLTLIIGAVLTAFMLLFLLIGFFYTPYDPVSYTHLDVYKRQALLTGESFGSRMIGFPSQSY